MPVPELPGKLAKKANKPKPRKQRGEGLAEAAQKNREREARLRIIDAFRRLGVPHHQWPDFAQAFYADPQQRVEYHQFATPSPFQAPTFDRLSHTPQEWAKVADSAWELHRDGFLKELEDWVRKGVDEEIVQGKRARGREKSLSAHTGGRRRGANMPVEQRYECAAKYLVHVPLKEIAGADADPTTVGRVAREIVRSAGWPTK